MFLIDKGKDQRLYTLLNIFLETLKFAKGSNLGACTVYGGTNVGNQRDKLRERNVNVIVATPGRLLQFIRDDTISLRKLMFFVLDEADRMLDMGFQGMYNFKYLFTLFRGVVKNLRIGVHFAFYLAPRVHVKYNALIGFSSKTVGKNRMYV